MKKQINNQKRILIMLCFFAISIGLWGNFRQLWLADNLLNAAEIAKTMSYASILAVLYLIYYTNVISINKLKLGVGLTLFLKILVTTLLALVNGIGDIHLIKFLFFVDIACENMILSSIYPFLISYQQKEEIYGKKSVVEFSSKTIGILLGSILFGRTFGHLLVNYNICLMISIIFLILSLCTLIFIGEEGHKKVECSNKGLLNYLKKEALVKRYFVYTLFTQISYYIVFGLNMLILTNYATLSPSQATWFVLIFSLLASIFGKLALNHLRSKNDYINFFAKFLVRTILYIFIFITNHSKVLLVGIAYFILTSVAYDYVINGFVNEQIKEQYTLGFTVVQYIINLVGEAIGVFLAGMMYAHGFRYIYLAASLFMVVQLGLGIRLISIKRKMNQIS